MTRPEQERVSEGHLISVFAQRADGSGSVQALVDGGFRGRRYGSALADLGPLDAIANQLVSDELLNDEAAKAASVVSAEKTASKGSSYYLVRYQVGGKPAIAKLAIIQQRLYCLKVKATAPAPRPLAFFDEASALQSEMEAIADSYNAAAVNYPCLEQSNKGSVPAAGVCKILRP